MFERLLQISSPSAGEKNPQYKTDESLSQETLEGVWACASAPQENTIKADPFILDYSSIRIPLEILLQKQCHRKHKPEFSSSGKFHLMQILYSLCLKKFLQFSHALNDT